MIFKAINFFSVFFVFFVSVLSVEAYTIIYIDDLFTIDEAVDLRKCNLDEKVEKELGSLYSYDSVNSAYHNLCYGLGYMSFAIDSISQNLNNSIDSGEVREYEGIMNFLKINIDLSKQLQSAFENKEFDKSLELINSYMQNSDHSGLKFSDNQSIELMNMFIYALYQQCRFICYYSLTVDNVNKYRSTNDIKYALLAKIYILNSQSSLIRFRDADFLFENLDSASVEIRPFLDNMTEFYKNMETIYRDSSMLERMDVINIRQDYNEKVMLRDKWQKLYEINNMSLDVDNYAFELLSLECIIDETKRGQYNKAYIDALKLMNRFSEYTPMRNGNNLIYECCLLHLLGLSYVRGDMESLCAYARKILDYYELSGQRDSYAYAYALNYLYKGTYIDEKIILRKYRSFNFRPLNDDMINTFSLAYNPVYRSLSYKEMDKKTMRKCIYFTLLPIIYEELNHPEALKEYEICSDRMKIVSDVLCGLYLDENGLFDSIDAEDDDYSLVIIALNLIFGQQQIPPKFIYYTSLLSYLAGDYDTAVTLFEALYNHLYDSIDFYYKINILSILAKCYDILESNKELKDVRFKFYDLLQESLHSSGIVWGTDFDKKWVIAESASRSFNRSSLLDFSDGESINAVYNNILAVKGYQTAYRNRYDKYARTSFSSAVKDDYQSLKFLDDFILSYNSPEIKKSLLYNIIEASFLAALEDSHSVNRKVNVSTQQIKRVLRKDECAIEFYLAEETPDSLSSEINVYALVLKKDYDYPHAVRIEAKADVYGDCEEDLRELYRSYWEPLKGELEGVNRVFFSLDRYIDYLPIEFALDDQGRTFSETMNCHRLSSTKEVVNRARQKAPVESAVLYGGLDFMQMDSTIVVPKRSGKRGDTRGGFNKLEWTIKEVDSICAIMDTADKDYIRYIDDKGLEGTFAALEGKPVSILHLATHGVTITQEDIEKEYSKLAGVKLFELIKSSKGTLGAELWQNGLAMSGCNRTLMGRYGDSIGLDDGILTAAEISQYDLSGVDLVVMSSCHSGLYGGADGYGLQRGFKLAGAHSLLMTLWSVDDEATQIFMVEFYRNYLSGKSKSESLQAAQRVLRNTKGFSDPVYWAPFILVDE